MKLSAILAPLIARKADHATIMDVVMAFEAEQIDVLEKRRESDRKRQADKRSRDITLRHSDRPLTTRVEGSSSKEDITNKEESVSPAAQPKRASRLPADWTLPEEWLAEAVAAGMSRQRALSEAERMKNWSLSNKNGAKLDWLATWRNWYRDKIDPYQLPAKPPDRPPRNAGEAARLELKRRENDHAPSTPIRHIDEGDGGPGFAGTGIARRIALASSR